MYDQILETVHYLRQSVSSFSPKAGIILGSGLGGMVADMDVRYTFPYSEIPNFPVSTVTGHKGNLLFGYLKNTPVMAMQGRFHYYEGYSMQEVTFPIRVMKLMGIETLLVSNASGGMNPEFKVGDIMVITDHINLCSNNPLIGSNDERLGPRFPDMSEVYDKRLIQEALRIGEEQKIKIKCGVYVAVPGPCFETPAEYRYMRIIGGDAVGMSTVPEVIVARHSGLKCFGISVITDLGVEGVVQSISHEEVVSAAKTAEAKITTVIRELLPSL